MDGSSTADRVDRAAHAREPVDILGISKRLQKDPRWLTVIEPLRTRMMREGRQKGMSKPDAQAWTYSELDRLYPPRDTEGMPASDSQTEPAHPGRVTGLGDLPDDWPQLPANASLQVEVSWVTANRLRVRDGNGVDLPRALGPAPSHSALSWLETALLFPSKFADVAVKVTSTQEDEREHVRREKLAIQEIRDLLAEMVEEGEYPSFTSPPRSNVKFAQFACDPNPIPCPAQGVGAYCVVWWVLCVIMGSTVGAGVCAAWVAGGGDAALCAARGSVPTGNPTRPPAPAAGSPTYMGLYRTHAFNCVRGPSFCFVVGRSALWTCQNQRQDRQAATIGTAWSQGSALRA